ncbi:hypothetical protein vseg_005874 [Gypsophila vaccaria]
MKMLKERTRWMIILLVSMVILPTLGYDKITWRLDTGTDTKHYTDMLTSLRGKLQSGTVCAFPATSAKPLPSKQFILMDIVYTKDGTDITITLAFQTSNTYFLGFRDVFNGVARASFVSDEYNKLKDVTDLFSDAVGINNRKMLPFASSYASMESAAGVKRGNLAIGVENLGFLINKVYGKAYAKKELAKFGLTVVQMVAEAARFKHIENDVIKGGLGKNNFKPDSDMVALQMEWGKISQAIHISSTAKKPCDKLENKKFTFPKVDTVAELRPYISVIKHKDSNSLEAGNTTFIDLMEVMEPEFM